MSPQVEQGHLCPISMTYAVIPALRHAPAPVKGYERGPHRLCLTAPPALLRPGVGLLAGMSIIEKQGTLTSVWHHRRRPAAGRQLPAHRPSGSPGPDERPVPDPGAGARRLTCRPRVLPDQVPERDPAAAAQATLGNRSNASSEIEYPGAARLAGRRRGPRRPDDHRDGVDDPARLRARRGRDPARRRHRGRAPRRAPVSAFGARLADQPLMREASPPSWPRRARRRPCSACGLRARWTGRDGALLRLAPSRVAKYLVCKRTSAVVAGGPGVLGRQRLRRGSPDLSRLYREAPLELDLGGFGQRLRWTRAARDRPRTARAVDALLAEIDLAAGADQVSDATTAARWPSWPRLTSAAPAVSPS
ncbi:hypothetical protein HBB16_14920 [Pseudonocardia sp. MCCB 268]|nr:hypothetical protein [Pseudonocardia cytotoxica]